MFPSNYQVNFTQTLEKPQKVKWELGPLPSAEVEADENKSGRQTIETHVYENFYYYIKN